MGDKFQAGYKSGKWGETREVSKLHIVINWAGEIR